MKHLARIAVTLPAIAPGAQARPAAHNAASDEIRLLAEHHGRE